MSTFYPLRFKHVYKDYIWGGDRIIRHYHRSAPAGVYAESWEVSDRPEGMSVVANGACAGRTLAELVKEWGANLLGKKGGRGKFPLLIKLIDARETLSVQVHPNDLTAWQHGGEAKTEMWYVLDADPGALLYCGLHPGVTPQVFDDAIRTNQFGDILRKIPVKAGDAVYVPGGRVHAIGSGCLLLEVQQNSNTTYRIYDWGRVGNDGKPRQLHIEEAKKVVLWQDDGATDHAKSPYFRFKVIDLKGPETFTLNGDSFHVVFNPKEPVELNGDFLVPGTSTLIPAALPSYTVSPASGTGTIIQISVP